MQQIGDFTCSNVEVPTATNNYEQPVDQLLEDFLKKTGVPGISISVRKAGDIIYSKGFGYADMEQKVEMKPTSQIRTASVAKVITATALGKLATDGLLNLDTPIGEYMPYLNAPYAQLTARQIASHTAGIPHRPASKRAKAKHYQEVKETLVLFKDLPLLFEPGMAYQYSSLGYNLLAILIEEISGKPYVDYMKYDIFQALGMTQTFPDNPTEFSQADSKMYYFKNGTLSLDKKPIDGSYKLAGAGFRSTSLDLVKMMDAYSNGFIAAEVIQTMFSSNTLLDGSNTNVGVGWRLNRDMNHLLTIEHAGSWQGARTVIVYYPASKLSVAIMINAKCSIFIEETAQIIAQYFLDQQQMPAFDRTDLDHSLTVNYKRSDGSTTICDGRLQWSKDKTGMLSVATKEAWLQDNRIFKIPTKGGFALSTKYGLMYLHLTAPPKLEGQLFQYQVLGDKYHVRKEPMVHFWGSTIGR